MKITKLSSENILRLNAIEITPDGNLIVIGGLNGEGKTSVLDSILLAMGGRQAKHTKPLKKGAKKGKIVVELDDLIVTRTFTKAGGGTLTVTPKDGMSKFSSPQAMLDKLIGQLTFDPLAWANMNERKQYDTLRDMVGLNFDKMDEKRKELYDERTLTNREVERLKNVAESLEYYEDMPEEEISVSELMKEYEIEQQKNTNKNEKITDLQSLNDDIVYIKNQIKELEQKLEEAKNSLTSTQEKHTKLNEEILEMVDGDEDAIKEQIDNAESINKKICSNNDKAEAEAAYSDTKLNAEGLTVKIQEIDQDKADQLASAQFPVEHMSFDEGVVTYRDLPFSQASSAEALCISVDMGIAMNPELKVLLIRDGSLLDEHNLQMIANKAEKSGHQIWLERVSTGDECSVIIEDGSIKEAEKTEESEEFEEFEDI